MTKETFESVMQMVDKELSRTDLTEVCDYYAITTGDFYQFCYYARRGFRAELADNLAKEVNSGPKVCYVCGRELDTDYAARKGRCPECFERDFGF
jgi:hypothetical protein